ncbi:MAG TPA: DUF6311 domain-containing protein, partial [Casimicrobiaceae bacterium]|nr:DUF6311 domain-containing protein [Casimicrobiaceae bacterium]
ALIHAYLLYMVLAVAFADAARRRWIDHTATTRDTLRSTLLIAVPLLGTMWLAGYFTIPTSSFSGGAAYYGRYAANLNSLWNPQWGSLFLPGLPVIPGSEFEGFNYLGFGVLAMTPVALLPLLRSRAFPVAKAYLPLLIVSLGLWLMALSNQIAWGNRILLNVPVPLEILNFVAMVRGSGRLLWVAYYALVLAIPALIVRNYSPLAATAILGIGLALQIADLSPRFVTLNHYFHQHFIDEPAQRTNPLKSPFWNAAARHYTTILFVPSLPVPKDFGSLALFAADHGMKINTGSFARYSVERVADATARRIRELEDGHRHRDSLYVLADPNSTPFRAAPDDATGIVDGYLVLAPGWFGFEESRDGTEPSLVPSDVTASKPNSILP